MRIVITGGTGLIGRALTTDLDRDGHAVVILSRNPRQSENSPARVSLRKWDARTAEGWGDVADGADAIVNLAGANLAGEGFFPSRWTDARKQLIRDSRINAGKAVVEAVKAAANKPRVVIQASAVGYYGLEGDHDMAEDHPPADDFLARVCVDWERSTAPVEEMGVRHAIIRSAPPLSFKAGALYRLALPFKLFVGGPMGSGRQPFPWIHPDDEIGAIRFLIDNPDASGAFNLASPGMVTNAEFGKSLGKVLRRPYWFPTPGFGLKLAFGEVASVVLTGQRAVPKHLLDMGFKFKFPEAEAALRDLYQSGR